MAESLGLATPLLRQHGCSEIRLLDHGLAERLRPGTGADTIAGKDHDEHHHTTQPSTGVSAKSSSWAATVALHELLAVVVRRSLNPLGEGEGCDSGGDPGGQPIG